MVLLQLPYLPEPAKPVLDNFFDLLFGVITFPVMILGAIFQTLSLFTTPRCLSLTSWAMLAFILLIHVSISRLALPKLKLCWQIYQEKQKRNQLVINEGSERVERREIQPSMFDILIRGEFLETCDVCSTSFSHKEMAKMLKIHQIFQEEKWRKRLVCPECKKKMPQ